MANPGYPQMGQMPPGMGPPMGGPPMGPPMGGPPMGGMPPRPMTRGTPKIVPVIVSAGLAVGVFCGLLFGVGTGKKAAAAEPSKGTNAKDHPVEDTTNMVVTPTKPITPTAQLGGSAAGSATGSAAGSGAGSGSAMAAAGSAAGSAAPAVKMSKLTITVKPDAAASAAKIQIDGKDITGNSIELPSDKKSVKVSITAPGYHSLDKTIDVLGDDTAVEIELVKRGGGASPGFGGTDTHAPKVPTRPPGGDKPPPKKKPGGLIDI
jgi:hypothetical protein